MLALAGLLALARDARAQPEPSSVVLSLSCDGLDRDELERLLELELVSLGPLGKKPAIRASCTPDRVDMVLHDPETGWHLEREIPALDPSDPGRERVLAIALSQLVIAWLPLRSPLASRTLVPRVQTVVLTPPAPGLPAAAPGGALPARTLGISVGAAARNLSAPVLLQRVAADSAGRIFRALSLSVELSAELGGVRRANGTASAFLGSAGMGLAWEPAPAEPFYLRLEVGGAAAWARLAGHADRGAEQGSVDGGGLGGSLRIGAGLRVHPVELALRLEGGALVTGARGWVQGDESVSLDGVWLGTSVRIGVLP